MSFTRILLHRCVNNFKRVYPQISLKHYSQSSVNLSDPAVQTYLRHLMLEHESLLIKTKRDENEIRRLREIKPIVQVLEDRIALYDSIESLKELNKKDSQDNEMKDMIKQEAEIYLKRLKEIDEDLQAILLEPCLTDGGVLLEVCAGAGGQEAMLFARELFQLYTTYTQYREWEMDVAGIEESDIGGYKKASMLIQGFGVPELMRMEAGVHRVQRVPATEKSGRIHTSTVTVAVLPQPTEIELNIPERDLLIETKRASGAGGQHVNTTDSAVRIVHVPTGTAVECQEGRSQIKNRQIAIQKLRVILLQRQYEDQTSKIKEERKSQIGSANRNEKIRTYNYPQDRVTEHREVSEHGGKNLSLKVFMEGTKQLEQLQENLLRQHRYQEVMNEIHDFIKKHKVEPSA